MNPTQIELAGTIFFAIAVIHVFMANQLIKISYKFPKDSIKERTLHYVGEVEVVFGLWAAVFLVFYSIVEGFAFYDSKHLLTKGALYYLDNLNFTEAVFVFVVMSIAATRPIIKFVEMLLKMVSAVIPLPSRMAFYMICLTLGPILGSFITEPAAMTLLALILLEYYYKEGDSSEKFRYATLGLLFVNVSIGGTLTHYAAPPVLMVARGWGWDAWYMLTHFGYKSLIACMISTLAVTFLFRRELQGELSFKKNKIKVPFWVTSIHLIFLFLAVYTSHYMAFFLGLFLFFLGFISITEKYQGVLKLKEALLVGFFLGGLIVLGNQQAWWLQHVLDQLGEMTLYLGVAAMTAVTDNAALTYLGSLVELSDIKKYYLVAGAVAGGGLTVIANAPNPAGYSILKKAFGSQGIRPLPLLLSALFPTAIALFCLMYL